MKSFTASKLYALKNCGVSSRFYGTHHIRLIFSNFDKVQIPKNGSKVLSQVYLKDLIPIGDTNS